MFETMRNAWKTPELRKKLLYTLLIIVIFRLGCAIPVPFLDPNALSNIVQDGNIFGYLDMLSGGALSKGTVFALSIQPYINASIIVQLLTYALPPLENLQKEGEEGRKNIQKITGYVALAISLVMSYAYYLTMRKMGAVDYTSGFEGVFAAIVIMAVFTAGSNLIVFLGNLVNENGIGNGISIILFAGIVARCPSDVKDMVELAISDPNKYVFPVIFVLLIYVVMIGFIVLMNEAERRIPIQYAKRVVGRKQYGGQNTHIPVKIAMSGVMPIIFAMAFMSIPQTIEMFVAAPTGDPATWSFGQKFYHGFLNFFNYSSGWYAVIYFILIIAFNYFYVSMQYNPIEIANNLRQNNGGIPGIRPGKPTSDFIQRVLSKITLIGAVCLGIIAIFPILFHMAVPAMNISMGGTSILIIVSVVLETVRTMESQMMMRHHKGFLE
ncbi:preprotein translocase subunit SecY [Huintestinicola butyrica]|uniref:preprotein translocase subunit SecY n=1 Tax=Huintestinicola butyrica TaxID=2981728 RepID=UPI003F7FF431